MSHHHAATPWTSDPAFWAVAIVLAFYLTPILWVLFSSRSCGGAKFGWFIVVLLFSWLGLAAFLIVTQITRKDT